MKRLVVLSGLSGIGKTTTFVPLAEQLGYVAFESGDFLKSIVGNIHKGSLPEVILQPGTPYTGSIDMLREYAASPLFKEGIQHYESHWKKQDDQGRKMSWLCEALRVSYPAWHIKQMKLCLPDRSNLKVVTSTINKAEFTLINREFLSWDITLVHLDCSDPVRTGNRQPVESSPASLKALGVDHYKVSYTLADPASMSRAVNALTEILL